MNIFRFILSFNVYFLVFLLLSCKSTQLVVPVDAHKEATLLVNGMKRKMHFYIPPGFDKEKIPLVIVLHGGGGNGRGMVMTTKMSDYAEKLGFAVAYPTGYANRWNDGRGIPNSETDTRNTPDILYLKRVKDYFVNQFNIDSERVYIVGFSNGGFMTTRAICETKNVFRSYAVVGAGISVPFQPKCNEPDKKPILFIWGKEDEVVPFAGGEILVPTSHGKQSVGFTYSYNDTLLFFKNRFQCRLEEVQDIPGLLNRSYGRVTKSVYTGCEARGFVQGYAIENERHTWPGGFYYHANGDYGYNKSDLNATETILRFFLGGVPEIALKSQITVPIQWEVTP